MALPKGYTTPEAPSQYFKFEEGANTFRVLSDIIVGEVYWTKDGEGKRKPNRVRTYDELPDEVKRSKDREEQAKHFWAMVVFNVKTKEIQILEITQRGIMKSLEALEADTENWGDLKQYSITITKTKTGSQTFDVEYSVRPLPPKPMEEGVEDVYKAMHIRLEALYEGADPFAETADQEASRLADDAEKAGL